MNWGLKEIFEPENLIQKHKPVIPENQLAWGIPSKSNRGLLAGVYGGEATHKNGGFMDAEPLT